MAEALHTDLLLQLVGKEIKNHNGTVLGHIAEVLRDKNGQKIHYLVLKSEVLFGPGERFFAIPVSSLLIKINEGGNAILTVDKDELQFAKGISYKNCPEPNFKFNPSIFELYEYVPPKNMVS